MPALRALAFWGALLLAWGAGPAAAQSPIRLKVIGGLWGVSQYTRYEAPFWQERITRLTQGRVLAEIEPFDRSGILPGEMLHLMRLGVVPFGTILISSASTDEPELLGADLPVLNPEMERLRHTVAAYQPRLFRLLAESYDIEGLAIYAYPAQALFCARPFNGLADLAGRRVRVSSVGQADVVTALGATPVVTPFAEVVAAVRNGSVECAITGTLSGNTIGLSEVTTHVHAMAISWGLSVFGVHRPTFNSLPPDIQRIIREGLRALESEIWTAAEDETEDGLACNAGRPNCRNGRPGRMTIVPVSDEDEARRRMLLREVVLPAWLSRCGPSCADAWNESLAASVGMPARP
ncbi:TRAP transporter substrate-binding protein [Roseococcus sp. YIM B11640]|uniref:TRAP transporter substrate-binding protein n=1 Tax=Roseococcus sp. YIM B11640 TaxID=3133973 RepID=UPI003C7CA992